MATNITAKQHRKPNEWHSEMLNKWHKENMVTDCEKRQLKDRLYDLIEKMQGSIELIDADDTALARVQLMDVAGQVQRVMLKLR